MPVYKSKWFSKWADQEDLTDRDLSAAVQEMANGLIEADLGGHVMKKRVGRQGQGKVAEPGPCWCLRWVSKPFLCMALRKISKTTSALKS